MLFFQPPGGWPGCPRGGPCRGAVLARRHQLAPHLGIATLGQGLGDPGVSARTPAMWVCAPRTGSHKSTLPTQAQPPTSQRQGMGPLSGLCGCVCVVGLCPGGTQHHNTARSSLTVPFRLALVLFAFGALCAFPLCGASLALWGCRVCHLLQQGPTGLLCGPPHPTEETRVCTQMERGRVSPGEKSRRPEHASHLGQGKTPLGTPNCVDHQCALWSSICEGNLGPLLCVEMATQAKLTISRSTWVLPQGGVRTEHMSGVSLSLSVGSVSQREQSFGTSQPSPLCWGRHTPRPPLTKSLCVRWAPLPLCLWLSPLRCETWPSLLCLAAC